MTKRCKSCGAGVNYGITLCIRCADGGYFYADEYLLSDCIDNEQTIVEYVLGKDKNETRYTEFIPEAT